MGRRPCCSKVGLNRGSWSAREDMILKNYVLAHGEGKWRDLPRRAGLQRCGKSCRLRWLNYLRPDIKRGNITKEEEELIIRLHNLLGNRWSLIAGRLPGRTDNEIKNYWNTNLSKRLNGVNTNSCGSPSVAPETTTATATASSKKRKKAKDSRRRPRTTNAASPPQNHSVVRTKAVRCTGIYADRNDDEVLLRRNRESKTNITKNINHQLATPPAQLILDVDDDPLDLFMGMDVDDFMSEIQGTHDLFQECCASDYVRNIGEQIDQDGGDGSGEIVCPDHVLRLEDELLEEWKDCLRPKVENDDFEDLISFLDQ